jgi:hypothetical protein
MRRRAEWPGLYSSQNPGSLNPWIDLMNFDIIRDIKEIETIATGQEIREIDRLRKTYGPENWRKMKGIGCFL